MHRRLIVQFTLFALVGGLALVLDLVTFLIFASGLSVVVANLISVSLSTMAAFLGHLLVTFQRVGLSTIAKTSTKFMMVTVIFGFINYTLSTSLMLVISGTMWGQLEVKIVVILALAVLRFIILKWWVFT